MQEKKPIPVPAELEESLEWLAEFEEPWEEAESHWLNTWEYRRNKFGEDFSQKVVDVIQDWPILRTPKGYLLICMDFQLMQLGQNEQGIDTKFTLMISKILEINPLREDNYLDLIQDLFKENNCNEGE